ncbi:MAG: hypothetical protein FJY73_10075 [Candidatus Eisenbacteria bacterium]|nr:hypothetical protein [Candidatus Eisenbacteria bacterium]
MIHTATVDRIVRAAGLLSAAGWLCMAGCFFEPRDAEPPGGGGGTSEPAKSPEEVTEKLVTAFETFHRPQYQLLLAGDFRFVPDRADSTDLADAGHTPFEEPWGLAREEDVFSRIQSCFNNSQTKMGTMDLEYTGNPIATDSSVTGYSTYESDYDLTVYYVTLVSPSREDSVLFDGSMKLFIRYESNDGTYRIYRWEDFRKGALRSWGYYKGEVAASLSYCPD